ncbi:ribbon-helix-helix protein, CopG family [Candidatus Kaiserbacteria bacterium]|nr:ribbon-helix-helix protein, CopG family [Candidatus Kaiserbacteria bacterium]
MSTNQPISSSVLSVRVPEELKGQLESLSRATKRSKAYLAAEALADYVRKNAWKAQELQTAIKEADKGVFISHEAMTVWVDSLANGKKIRAPKPDVFPKRRAS